MDNNMSYQLDFMHTTDLEWLSLNWRKFRAAMISLSVRRLILIMFESSYEYFPTLQEIKTGLVKGQMSIINKEKDSWTDKTKF